MRGDKRRTIMWRLYMLLSLIGLFAWAAVPVGSQDTVTTPDTKTVTQTPQGGPVHMTLTADRTTLGLADRLQLTLTVEAPTGTQVILPEAAEQLGTFTVQGQTPTGPTSIDPQTQRWQQVYSLEAGAVGEQVIPSLSLSFREAGAAPDTAPTPLQTKPLSIAVTSVLPENADVMAPQDIAPPVALTPPRVSPWTWMAAAVIGLALAGGLFWWLRRRAQRPIPPASPPGARVGPRGPAALAARPVNGSANDRAVLRAVVVRFTTICRVAL